jgi:hypothetical protein
MSKNFPSPRQGGASNAPRPNNPPSQAPRQGAKPQQAPKRGRLNYTTAEEILEDAEVLMGTLFINFHPDFVLFFIPKQLFHSSTRSSCYIVNFKCKLYNYHTI